MNIVRLIAGICLLPVCALAQEVNLSTTVTGNQEQPKVLYIIPWQNAERGEAPEGSMDSALKDVFALVDRNELKREIDTLEALIPETRSAPISE